MSVRLRLAAPLLPLLPLFQTAPACRGKRTPKNHIAFLHSLQSIMVLPDVNNYKEMDCARASAFRRRDTNLKVSKAQRQHGLVGKSNQSNKRVTPVRPRKPQDKFRLTQWETIPGPEETYQDMIFKLGYRQEERHSTLTATFAGSNPASPTKAQFYLSST